MPSQPARRRRKRYRIKPAGVALILILLALIVLIAWLLLSKLGGDEKSPSSPPASSAESGAVSAAGGEPNSSVPQTESGSEPQEGSAPEGGESSGDGDGTASGPVSVSPADISPAGEIPYGSYNSGKLTIPTDSTRDFLYTDGNGKQYTINRDVMLATLPSGSLSDWNLILLNPEENNKIDQDIDVDMTKFDTQWVDSRAAESYQSMCDGAKAAGNTLYLRSGFRNIATQTTNYNNNIQRLISQGVTEAEAIRQTQVYYTVPGHSEHHTGLAFDILTPQYHNDVYTLDERFAQTDAYPWLIDHSAEYGFILRYPKDKEDITQIGYEPWHYRYVGVEHAKFIKKYNLCFEEYVQLLRMRDGA